MPTDPAFECNQCGRCCLKPDYIAIEDEDRERFRAAGRHDLVAETMLDEWYGFGSSGLFRNRTTKRCPWLRKVRGEPRYYCSIYEVRPNVCRRFATERGQAHAEQFCQCPGFGTVFEIDLPRPGEATPPSATDGRAPAPAGR